MPVRSRPDMQWNITPPGGAFRIADNAALASPEDKDREAGEIMGRLLGGC